MLLGEWAYITIACVLMSAGAYHVGFFANDVIHTHNGASMFVGVLCLLYSVLCAFSITDVIHNALMRMRN